MKRVRALTAAAVGLTFLCADTADAQEQTWLADRKYREGAGFQVGDFELHPGIGAEAGYDSNFFRRDSSENPVGAVVIRVSPSFAVSTLSDQRRGDAPPPTVGFRFEVGGSYNEYIPVSGTQADKDTLQDNRNFGGSAKINLDILPGREWGGRIFGGVGRTILPTNAGDTSVTFNRVLPEAGAELKWAPDSGLLDWSLGYGFSGTFFEDSSFSGLNNYRNDINTRGRWRFLPRTALMYDASFGFITYANAAGSQANKSDSHPLRARIGVNGLVTPTFGVLGLVGWGASFYDTDTDHNFDSVLAQAELKWYLSPPSAEDPMAITSSLSHVAVGFIRDYADSFIGTYLEQDMGYARFSYLFGGKFVLVAEARAGAVVFPAQNRTDLGAQASAGWTDAQVNGKLFGEYRFMDWLGVNAEVTYTGYFSSTSLAPPGDPPNALAFQRVAAFAGLRAFW
jgi:hypothetical protein